MTTTMLAFQCSLSPHHWWQMQQSMAATHCATYSVVTAMTTNNEGNVPTLAATRKKEIRGKIPLKPIEFFLGLNYNSTIEIYA